MNAINKAELKTVLQALLKFLLLAALMLLVPAAVYADLVIMGHGMPEAGITEYFQEGLLLLSVFGFFMLAHLNRDKRGFAILIGGFFGTMLIREFDGMFDAVKHGFWVYPAMAWVGLIMILAARFRHGLLEAMASATRSRSFAYIVIGLAIVLAFSRVFGTSSLWSAALDGAAATALVKNAVQEGLELLGYLLIFSGTIGYCQEARSQAISVRSKGFSPGSVKAVRRRLPRRVQRSMEKRKTA